MDSATQPPRGLRSAWFVAAVFFPAILFVTVGLTVSKFRTVLAEMMPDEPLPELTVWCLMLTPTVAVVAFVLVIPGLLLKEYRLRDARLCRWVNVAATVLALVFFHLYLLGLFLPLVKLPSLGE